MVDVLVIGGGNAALCAALMAREAGASVQLLEGSPREWRGGNSQHTRNLRCMHDAPQDVLVEAYPEEEFSDEVVNDARVVELRNKVQATVDDSIREESVLVTAVLNDGSRIEVRVEHAIGSLQNPLSDAQLEAKFTSLVTPVLGAAAAAAITSQWRGLAGLRDVAALVKLCRA